MPVDPLEQTRTTPLHVRFQRGEFDGIDFAGDASGLRLESVRRSLHDMGSPLSTMRVLVELLRLTGGSMESRNQLTEMLDTQITELTEGLLALLRELPPADPD